MVVSVMAMRVTMMILMVIVLISIRKIIRMLIWVLMRMPIRVLMFMRMLSVLPFTAYMDMFIVRFMLIIAHPNVPQFGCPKRISAAIQA